MSLCPYICMSIHIFLFASFCFLFLLVFSFCSPFLLLSVPFSFLSPLWFPFFVSSFLPPSFSSIPFHLFLLALSSFPVFVFLLPRFLLSFLLPPAPCSFFLSFFPLLHLPFPPTLLCCYPFFSSFLLLFFSSLILFLPSFSSSSFLSYCPVLLFSPLSLLLLFLLFLVLQLFLFFVFSSSIACFFLSFCYHFLPLPSPNFFLFFPLSPPPLFSLPLLSFFRFSFPFGY